MDKNKTIKIIVEFSATITVDEKEKQLDPELLFRYLQLKSCNKSVVVDSFELNEIKDDK